MDKKYQFCFAMFGEISEVSFNSLNSVKVLSGLCSVCFSNTDVLISYKEHVCQGSGRVRANIYVSSGSPDLGM